MQQVLTVQDLKERLNVGTNRAYELMQNEAFPSYKIGKKYFVTDEALNKWLVQMQGRKFAV